MKQIQKIYNNVVCITNDKIIIKDNSKYYDLFISSNAIDKNFIINKELFITEYLKQLKKHNLNKFLWRKNITIITPVLYSYNEKKILRETFKEIGYKKITIKPIESFLNINKDDYYLINNNILRLFYVDKFNKKGYLDLNQDILSEEEIGILIKNRCKNKRLFIINQNEKILSLMEKLKLNYYYYEKNYSFF